MHHTDKIEMLDLTYITPLAIMCFNELCFFYRNLTADVTRFVPTALRVKRGEDKQMMRKQEQPPKPELQPKPGATKDDAYSQFMREMEGLL